jgi:hypothetical protein
VFLDLGSKIAAEQVVGILGQPLGIRMASVV